MPTCTVIGLSLLTAYWRGNVLYSVNIKRWLEINKRLKEKLEPEVMSANFNLTLNCKQTNILGAWLLFLDHCMWLFEANKTQDENVPFGAVDVSKCDYRHSKLH